MVRAATAKGENAVKTMIRKESNKLNTRLLSLTPDSDGRFVSKLIDNTHNPTNIYLIKAYF